MRFTFLKIIVNAQKLTVMFMLKKLIFMAIIFAEFILANFSPIYKNKFSKILLIVVIRGDSQIKYENSIVVIVN